MATYYHLEELRKIIEKKQSIIPKDITAARIGYRNVEIQHSFKWNRHLKKSMPSLTVYIEGIERATFDHYLDCYEALFRNVP